MKISLFAVNEFDQLPEDATRNSSNVGRKGPVGVRLQEPIEEGVNRSEGLCRVDDQVHGGSPMGLVVVAARCKFRLSQFPADYWSAGD